MLHIKLDPESQRAEFLYLAGTSNAVLDKLRPDGMSPATMMGSGIALVCYGWKAKAKLFPGQMHCMGTKGDEPGTALDPDAFHLEVSETSREVGLVNPSAIEPVPVAGFTSGRKNKNSLPLRFAQMDGQKSIVEMEMIKLIDQIPTCDFTLAVFAFGNSGILRGLGTVLHGKSGSITVKRRTGSPSNHVEFLLIQSRLRSKNDEKCTWPLHQNEYCN